MAGFQNLLIGMLLAGLVIFALLNAGTILMIGNGKSPFSSDDTLGPFSSSLSGNLSGYAETVKGADQAFSNSTITTSTGIPFVDSIGAIWKTIRKTPIMIYDLTMGLVYKTFLSDSEGIIVISIFGAILSLVIIFAVWRVIATGQAEGK